MNREEWVECLLILGYSLDGAHRFIDSFIISLKKANRPTDIFK